MMHPLIADGIEALAAEDAHEALRCFERALIENPRLGDAHFLRAKSYLILKDRARALKELDQALTVFPNQAAWRAVRAKLLFQQRAYQQALDDLDQIGRDGALTGLRGQCHEALGDSAKALADYVEAVSLGAAEFEPRREQLKKTLQDHEILMALLTV